MILIWFLIFGLIFCFLYKLQSVPLVAQSTTRPTLDKRIHAMIHEAWQRYSDQSCPPPAPCSASTFDYVEVEASVAAVASNKEIPDAAAADEGNAAEYFDASSVEISSNLPCNLNTEVFNSLISSAKM